MKLSWAWSGQSVVFVATMTLLLSGCVVIPVPAGPPTTTSNVKEASLETSRLFAHPSLHEKVSQSVAKALSAQNADIRIVESTILWEDTFPQALPISLKELLAPQQRRALIDSGVDFLVLISPGRWVYSETSIEPLPPFYASQEAKKEFSVSIVDLWGGSETQHIKVESSSSEGAMWPLLPIPMISFFIFVWDAPPTSELEQAAYESIANEVVRSLHHDQQETRANRVAILGAAGEEDSTVRKLIVRSKALQGDREAIFLLARDFHDATGLRVLAEQGDREAAVTFAKNFDVTRYLEALAEQGDREAAFQLATYSGDVSALRRLAEGGNLDAAKKLFKMLEQLGPETAVEAWKWRCEAANAADGEAQSDVGYWHRWVIWLGLSSKLKLALRAAGVNPDDRIAYMWYTLAIRSGDEYAIGTRSYVVNSMTKEEITQAEQMARDWKPGDCPSSEHRLGLP